MFAVLKTGGKQYKVSEGDIMRVERLEGSAGDTVTLDHILMVKDGDKVTVGTPTVSGTVVTAEILDQARTDKITVFKKKRRHNYRRKKGHRQNITVLRVTGIGSGAKKAAPKKAAKAADKAEDKATEKKAAPKKASAAKKPAAKKSTATKKPAAKKAAPKKAE